MAQRAVDTRDTPPCVLELIRRFFLYKKNPVHQEHQAPNDRGVFFTQRRRAQIPTNKHAKFHPL